MLTSMRSKAGGWVAKAFILLLAASFAVWGVADVFSGRQSDTLAEVGTREISATEFTNAFNRQVRALSNQVGQPVTPDQARQLGVDRQVLGQLLRDAALEAQADQLNLGVSAKTVAQRIADNEQFQNASGEFNAEQFRRLLQNSGISEQAFVAAERQGLLRGAITESIISGVSIPRTMVSITHKHRTEQRDVSYFIIKGSKSDIPEPSDEVLKKFYETNQSLFAVPERRVIAVLQVTPQSLSSGMTVSDDELKQFFEQRKDDYGTPEKRTIEQIAFGSMEEAQAAYDKIKAGASFGDIAKERGLSDNDMKLGETTKNALPDQLIAEAAFALGANEVSQPVKGKLSTSLLRVTSIVPGSQKTFEEARDDVAKLVKLDRARDEVLAVHDKVEDGRAGGQTLADIARELGLPVTETPALDARGNDASGSSYSGNIADLPNIVRAAFDSDVGVDNDPLTTDRDGFTWYEVRDVKPASTRPLDDVRSDAISAWKARQLRTNLLERVQALKKRAESGESLETLAKELGAEIKQQTGIQRNEASEAISSSAVSALFAAPEDGYAVALEGDGEGARLMKSIPVFATPYDANSDEDKAIRQVLETGLNNDLYAAYLAALQSKLGVSVNEAAFNYATGGGQG